MPDKDLLEIQISRVIPAPRWRIIRLITKVTEFPSYIACVKEASLIQKTQHKMLTKWRVQVNGVPISWIEEDSISFKDETIHFKAIEGDLDEFYGKWEFAEHPEGTEVKVTIHIRVGIPMIKNFAEDYISKLLTQSFQAILEALEHRLISTRYAAYKRGETDKIAGFGIIGHFYNFNHMLKCLKILNPDLKIPSQEFLGQLFNLTPSFKYHDILNFKSKTGAVTNGCLIGATFIPDMLEQDMWTIFTKVVRACKVAEKHGVGIVTLGGFSSIVGERMGQEISSQVDVPVTTGNTFTAAMAIDGIQKAAELLELDLSKSKVAIIGGTGDIGSACSRVLASQVRLLTITGRTKSTLRKIADELSKKRKAKIIATFNNQSAVKDADIIIAAASASAAILKIDWFKPGAIICDVGYPKNISYIPTNRDDILIFSGGLAKSPTPIYFPIDMGLPDPDTIYGCFAEAVILALEKRFENFSFGRGNITSEKINEIRQLGKKHGFEVSNFFWGDKLMDEEKIAKIRRTVHA